MHSSAASTSRSACLSDMVAGVSVAGLLVPEAIAYSSIAALPPQHGVIALLAGLLCYGLIGRSRFAIVSATSSSAAVLAATTVSLAGGDASLRLALATGLVLLTGTFFLIAAATRLGTLSAFISKPVLRGFTFGLALVICIRQLPNIVGLDPSHNDLFHFGLDLLRRFDQWSTVGVTMGLVSLALLFVLKRWPRIPAALLLIALGIAAQTVWSVDQYGVALVGKIDIGFRTSGFPTLDRGEWLRLGELAFAMVFVLYAESYGSVRGFALLHGDRMYPNRELCALGLANIASGLFGGLPVGAGYSGTSANEAAGARSRVAAWVAALVVLIVVLTLLPHVAHTPKPVLAAIVINAVSHTLRLGPLCTYFRWRRDRLVLVFSIAAVLVLGILDGLLAAVGASLLLTLRDLSQHRISVLGRLADGHDFVNVAAHPEARQLTGLMIVRPEAPLFFANAEQVLTQVRKAVEASTAIRSVILSLEESPDLDGSSIEALAELVGFLHSRGIQLLLARLHDSAGEVLSRADIPHLPVSALSNWSVDDAVSVALDTLSEA